ncbi:MAG: MBL fold metallo-hydrolase [Defluviitaleaceae bacterium]|nr:MBL fold metallo-hydrolase [Defluviitaleaceae bacterium]
MLKIYPMPLGDYQANCYLLSKGDRALIVDPGDEAQKIITYLETKQLKPEAILLTHGHFDHIGALKDVQAKYGLPVYAHQDEKDYLTNPNYNFSSKAGRTLIEIQDLSAFHFLESDGVISLLDEEIEVRHVPGHSLGSIAFYFKTDGVVISGDALFKGSIGRTDLINGNHTQLINSIETKLFTLPDSTIVYSGHGQATTIADEKATNPFFSTH